MKTEEPTTKPLKVKTPVTFHSNDLQSLSAIGKCKHSRLFADTLCHTLRNVTRQWLRDSSDFLPSSLTAIDLKWRMNKRNTKQNLV